MIRNVQRLYNSPASDVHALYKDPVRVKTKDTRAAPGGSICRKRCRVAMALHQSPNLDRLLLRQRVEVAEDYPRAVVLSRLLEHSFSLLMLIVERPVRIDVNIEDSKLFARQVHRRCHR